MKIVSVALVAASLLFGASSALAANEVIVADGGDKAKSAFSLDIVSDGKASGFQFSIPVDLSARGAQKSLDLSRCLSDLPKTHQGKCVYRAKKQDVLVIVYSLDNKLLPEGIVGLGTVQIPGVNAKSSPVKDVIFASPQGKAL